MDINPLGLFVGFAFSVFGFYFFKKGKKQVNYAWVFTGIILMIYPYFITNVWWELLIGLALMGFAYTQKS